MFTLSVLKILLSAKWFCIWSLQNPTKVKKNKFPEYGHLGQQMFYESKKVKKIVKTPGPSYFTWLKIFKMCVSPYYFEKDNFDTTFGLFSVDRGYRGQKYSLIS